MNPVVGIKNAIQKIPYWPGHLFSIIPHKYKLGRQYLISSQEVTKYENASSEERYLYLIKNLNKIVNYAQLNIPFYQDLYGKELIEIKNLSDFEKLPIISKSQVRQYSKQSNGAFLLNTGGTSGKPLSFYVDKNVWAREWAHMHYIWNFVGYKPTNLMATLLGKNIGQKSFRYNAVHNEFILNPYINAKDIKNDLIRLFKKYPIKYFQGYPSSIFNFYKELEQVLNKAEKKEIVKNIKCCLLSSEYPQSYMIDYLKKNWGLDFISWYGHSEMCILAYDNKLSGQYKPLITYGYAEEMNGTLIGTSFHNYDMPLIRYSTDDTIKSKKNEYGIIKTFSITSGRSGDFIEDKNGKKIPLTSFVYGRHHKIFEKADFIQISQKEKGKASIIITFKDGGQIPSREISKNFDLTNIQMEFDFKFLKNPILTKSGKLKLKI